MLQFLKVTFDTTTGLLSGLTNLETSQSIKLKQNFYWSAAHSTSSSFWVQHAANRSSIVVCLCGGRLVVVQVQRQ